MADKPDEPNKPGTSAFAEALVSMSGASMDPHDIHPPGADQKSIQAGHEPDRFRIRTVLYVPILLVVSALAAFTVVTVTFKSLVRKSDGDPAANQESAAVAGRTLNERFARTSSTDPNAAVKQPRLEYLKQTETDGPKDDPAYMRSKRPVEADGATWELRPEDLRPARFVDPTLHRKILVETGWFPGSQKKAAHIPIAEAMKVLAPDPHHPEAGPIEAKAAADAAKKWLPVRKDPIKIAATTDGKAKMSNAGRGGLATPVAGTTPAAAVKNDDKTKPPHP